MRVLALLIPLFVALGCGGPSDAENRAARPDATSGGSDGCGPSQTRLGGQCWGAAGTRWRVRAEGPGLRACRGPVRGDGGGHAGVLTRRGLRCSARRGGGFCAARHPYTSAFPPPLPMPGQSDA